MQYQKGQQTLSTELVNGFCTEQIPYRIILHQQRGTVGKQPINKPKWESFAEEKKNLCIEENSCEVIVLLVLTAVELKMAYIKIIISKKLQQDPTTYIRMEKI